MQCPLCNCDVTADNTNESPGVKYGTIINGILYCCECSDVAYFAEDMSKSTPVKSKETANHETVKVEPTPVKTTNVIHFYCSKCKCQASGSKCDTCGTQNPLFKKRKK